MRALSQSLSPSERTRCGPNDALGHTADQQMRETSAAVRAHHDQVDVVPGRVRRSPRRRSAEEHRGRRLERGAFRWRQQRIEMFVCLSLPRLFDARWEIADRLGRIGRDGVRVLEYVNQVKRGSESCCKVFCRRERGVDGALKSVGTRMRVNPRVMASSLKQSHRREHRSCRARRARLRNSRSQASRW